LKQTPRSIAFRIIEKVTAPGHLTVKDQLSAFFAAHDLSPRDKTLVTELAYGVARRLNTLDWHIARCSDFGEIKRSLRNILRLGAYQLLYLDKVPVYAAIDESVEMAKKAGAKSAGFVNAVLRRIAREKAGRPEELCAERVQSLSVRYSFPVWLIRRWQGELGDRELEAFCAASNERPALSLRINTLRIRPAECAALLAEKGVEFEQCAHPLVLRVRSSIVSDELNEFFNNGYFFVQDEATVRVVDLLGPLPGERILDLCAAPGGKSTYCAQLMRDQGSVVAVDVNPRRMKMMGENIARMGTTIVRPETADVLTLRETGGAERYDRVLLDAPCSNQGVLAKRVEARWRLREGDISRMASLQQQMLAAAAPFVKPDGVLVYSTCSIDREEDESVVERFLGTHRHYSLEKMFKTWPHSDKIDGAFAARFRRLT